MVPHAGSDASLIPKWEKRVKPSIFDCLREGRCTTEERVDTVQEALPHLLVVHLVNSEFHGPQWITFYISDFICMLIKFS